MKQGSLVFLLDVDNTLLNNDRLKEDLADKLRIRIGPDRAVRFWQLYEEVRASRDYVDYPTTITRLADECHDSILGQSLQELLDAIPFRSYVYPDVDATLNYLKTLGTPVILSDGDPVFQPKKIQDSGLADAVDHRVLVYVHKEQELPLVFTQYPADHYVMIDDKPRILSALEQCCPTTFTTVLVRQGKYALSRDYAPEADIEVASIGDVRSLSRQQFYSGIDTTPAGGDVESASGNLTR